MRETGRGDITQFCYDAPVRETTIRFRETEEYSLENVADTLREHSDNVFIGDIAVAETLPHARLAAVWHARAPAPTTSRRLSAGQTTPAAATGGTMPKETLTCIGGGHVHNVRRPRVQGRRRGFIVVECPLLERLGKAGITVPAGADAVLAYVYVDHEQGLSLFALAPASLASGAVFHDASFPVAQGQFVILRSGSIPPESRVLFPDDAKALEGRYAEQIGRVEGDHATVPGVEAARKVELVDALRSPEYPDDVLAVLAADGLPQEGVWFRLEGLTGEGMLAGVLLNEPDADYSVHEGDLMALAPTRAEDGSPMLLTVPDLLISRSEG